MTALHFYNSLTRRQEPFHAINPGKVGMYTCGPTVYNFAHIGNFRAYVFEDILRRTLEFAGNKVTQVMNLTDVDDKTIRGAKAGGLALNAFTRPYIEAFFTDLAALNIEPAEVYPPATGHIPEMIALIEALFEKGLAYRSDDGSVYFSISKFPGYGKLAHIDPSQLRSGVRIDQDEYDKEAFADFALWKAWDENDGDVAWDSPWGRGRPGWHLECSAMAIKYLGESFDIHTGGIDNLFPHHENEIAQAEGATGKPFVKTWLHCAHLQVDGQKMSKSLGNFHTLRDLLGKGWKGREIRYVLLGAHYRQPLNFTFEALQAARTALGRIDECFSALEALAGSAVALPGEAPAFAGEALERFAAALADDLNTPEALSALFSLVKTANIALAENILMPAGASAALDAFRRMDSVLGVIAFERPRAENIPEAVLALLGQRGQARADRQWQESDRIRDLLLEMGWVVRDGKDGQTVKKAGR